MRTAAADRVDLADRHVLLAGHRHALLRRMALHPPRAPAPAAAPGSTTARDRKDDGERAPVLRDPQFLGASLLLCCASGLRGCRALERCGLCSFSGSAVPADIRATRILRPAKLSAVAIPACDWRSAKGELPPACFHGENWISLNFGSPHVSKRKQRIPIVPSPSSERISQDSKDVPVARRGNSPYYAKVEGHSLAAIRPSVITILEVRLRRIDI